METDNFSYKEILLQLILKVDAVNMAVNKQELLLNTIHQASASRDEKISELKDKVVILEDTVVLLAEKIAELKTFNKTLLAIWSGFILFISFFGKILFDRIF